MDRIFRQLEVQCAEPMSAYAECQERHPHTYPHRCLRLRKQVSACAEKYSGPAIERVHEVCGDVLDELTRCHDEHGADAEGACEQQFYRFVRCSRDALGEERVAQ